MNLNNVLSKLLGTDKQINEVQIDTKVVDEIIKIAKESDPNEYVASLAGRIDDDILKINGLIFLPFKASSTSATMDMFMMPIKTNSVGSVHSHPGPSAQPSNADLSFFAKNGYFHMIICRPYTPLTLKAYDIEGNPMSYNIVDLGDDVEIKQLNELDFDDDEYADLFKEGILGDDIIDEQQDSILNQQIDDTLKIDQQKEDIIDQQLKDTITPTNIRDDLMTNHENKTPQETKTPQESKPQAFFNLELESNGRKINKQIPLPPEYEPGDAIEVDIRTDKTPGDTIDEIILNIKKPGSEDLQVKSQMEPILDTTTVKSKPNTPKINMTKMNNNVIDIDPVDTIDTIDLVEPNKQDKSPEDIQKEIKELEADIKKLKEENERLKRGQ